MGRKGKRGATAKKGRNLEALWPSETEDPPNLGALQASLLVAGDWVIKKKAGRCEQLLEKMRRGRGPTIRSMKLKRSGGRG